MITYVTDNPYIKKEIPGSILTYQIFNWRISLDIESDTYVIKNTFKRKTDKEIIFSGKYITAIISRSNYKMIFDIFQIDKQRNIFYWDTFEKRVFEAVDFKKITKMMQGYLFRGYLSISIYNELNNLNMQRIEQLMVLLAIKFPLKSNNFEIVPVNYIKNTESISIFNLINALFCNGYSYVKIIDKLMYHTRRGDITDPFVGYFHFLKETSLFKIYNKHKNKKFRKKTEIIYDICFTLNNILPLVDILKTLRFIINNELLTNSLNIPKDFNKFITDDLLGFISKDKWDNVYKNNSFDFLDQFPVLQTNKVEIFCPVCGSSELKRTPLKYYCSNSLCPFSVNSVVKPAGIIKKISQQDLSRLLKFKSTIIKNRNGGYSKYVLVNTGPKYNIIPEGKSNNVGADNDNNIKQ